MTNQRFWDLIEKCNWKSDYNYERICQELKDLKFLNSKEEYKEFEKKFYETKNILYKKTFDFYNYGGDDSFDDMLSDTIGQGEKSYNNMINNPSYCNYNGKESFAYSFHVNW